MGVTLIHVCEVLRGPLTNSRRIDILEVVDDRAEQPAALLEAVHGIRDEGPIFDLDAAKRRLKQLKRLLAHRLHAALLELALQKNPPEAVD